MKAFLLTSFFQGTEGTRSRALGYEFWMSASLQLQWEAAYVAEKPLKHSFVILGIAFYFSDFICEMEELVFNIPSSNSSWPW